MSALEIILLIATAVGAAWQLWLAYAAVAMLRSGRYTKVTFGLLPGIVALVTGTILLSLVA